MPGTNWKTQKKTASVGDWLARAGFLVAGVVIGSVAGIVLLVVAVALFYLFCVGNDRQSGSTIPDGAWKMMLAVVAALGFIAGCFYLGGWQGVLIGGASVGGICGGILGLGARAAREKKRRTRESS